MTQLPNHNTLSEAERTTVGGLSVLGHGALLSRWRLLVSICFHLFPTSIHDFQHCQTWPFTTPRCVSVGVARGGKKGRSDKRNGTGMSLPRLGRKRVRIWLGAEGGTSREILIPSVRYPWSKLEGPSEHMGAPCCVCSPTAEESQQLMVPSSPRRVGL